MVTFADPRAAPRLARLLRRAEAGGIRWFREPGAWVERPRTLRPADLSTPIPAAPRNPTRWTPSD